MLTLPKMYLSLYPIKTCRMSKVTLSKLQRYWMDIGTGNEDPLHLILVPQFDLTYEQQAKDTEQIGWVEDAIDRDPVEVINSVLQG